MIAWHTERMAREGKRMRDLAHYLAPPTDRPSDNDAEVRAFFRQLERRQKSGTDAAPL